MKLLRITMTLLLTGWLGVAAAGLETFDFSGNVEEERFKELIAEIRCLVCQNQSLADSDAGLANDLRVEVYELMDQGNDDQQVIDFLVSRYGDFVLYDPPIKPETYFLWAGPFVLLLVGVIVLARTLKQRREQVEDSFTAEERAKLDALLGGIDEPRGKDKGTESGS